MKARFITVSIFGVGIFFISCTVKQDRAESKSSPLVGTWQLVSGTIIEKGDTTVTDYTKDRSFIKIINDTHFAFLMHDVNTGDSSAVYGSGGGKYDLSDSTYTEHLEYCSDREWE